MNELRAKCVSVALLATVNLIGVMGAASADSGFDADANGQVRRGESCPSGAFLCGDAVIAGLGRGSYDFHLTSFAPVSDSCGDYTAATLFSLSDGSTLTLDENGTVCGPGHSFFPTGGASYGNPVDGTGTWTVIEATGAFAGTTGSGDSELHSAGAHFSASYSGD